MDDRPILFSAPMVRALLNGTKTQTRRVVKRFEVRAGMPEPEMQSLLRCCPYGAPGDRLWVRETFMDLGACYLYRADAGAEAERALAAPGQPWKPAIHMPRAASRISLEVTGVRVERLQDISEADVQAEGCTGSPLGHAADAMLYPKLWDSINGPGAWERNPFVWVVEFRRI